jgi:protease I
MEASMSHKKAVDHIKKTALPEDRPETPQVQDSPGEMALDVANELSFPASDPISASNITRIEKAPETASAAADHQNVRAVKHTVAANKHSSSGKKSKS